uniref:Ig-like domain-containing protein n=1 Tax=Neogobius melanostomus TaxID=47308 RepID=A0A8C6TEA8_9GOBI
MESLSRRVEGEAVILSFPFLLRELKDRRMSLSGGTLLISKTNQTNAPNGTYSPEAEGRVLQRGAQLWLLPAQESDSGQYSCTYRSEAFCVRGALTLQVYSSHSMDMDRLSFPITLSEGEYLDFRCPSLSVFNRTETHAHWDKVRLMSETSYRVRVGERFDSGRGRLLIPTVRMGHRGLYRCEVKVRLNQRQFNVSRAVNITVQGEHPGFLLFSFPASEVSPPVILSPLNGSVFENSHGSGMELACAVLLTDCPAAESTLVMWLVDGQSVEASYLDGRALQGGRRVGHVPGGCHVEVRLIILEMRERDTQAELKCVAQNQHGRQEVSVRLQLEDSTHTWLVVSSVALLCFLFVVSVFLCILVRPRLSRSKVDYTLARQDSTF